MQAQFDSMTDSQQDAWFPPDDERAETRKVDRRHELEAQVKFDALSDEQKDKFIAAADKRAHTDKVRRLSKYKIWKSLFHSKLSKLAKKSEYAAKARRAKQRGKKRACAHVLGSVEASSSSSTSGVKHRVRVKPNAWWTNAGVARPLRYALSAALRAMSTLRYALFDSMGDGPL